MTTSNRVKAAADRAEMRSRGLDPLERLANSHRELNGGGSPGSHAIPNWQPSDEFDLYVQRCEQGLEKWSIRKAARLLDLDRTMLWRGMKMASVPKDLFELLLDAGIPRRDIASVGHALERQERPSDFIERCPCCGFVLRSRAPWSDKANDVLAAREKAKA